MKNWKLFAATLLISCASLSAVDLRDNVSLVGGYQHGNFKQTNTIELPNAGTGVGGLVLPAGYESVDSFNANNLHLGVFGVEGRVRFPELTCGCDYDFLRNFYVEGHAIWGWGGNKDSFSEKVNGIFPGAEGTSYRNQQFSTSGGKLSKARTYDYQVGLGYLIDPSMFDFLYSCGCGGLLDGWDLGISGGYTYKKQTVTVKSADSTNVIPNLPLNPGNFVAVNDATYPGQSLSNRWQGGYIGAELFYQTCEWDFSFGYEYHIVNYRGKYNATTLGLDSGVTSTKLSSNRADGSVWTLRGSTELFCGWDLGALFKYESWRAHGASGSVSAPAGFSYNTALNTTGVSLGGSAHWYSYTIAATLGYDF